MGKRVGVRGHQKAGPSRFLPADPSASEAVIREPREGGRSDQAVATEGTDTESTGGTWVQEQMRWRIL